MTSKATVCVLILLAGLLCQVASAQMDSWMFDRKLAADLIENGVVVETDRATLWFEGGALESDARTAFAELGL